MTGPALPPRSGSPPNSPFLRRPALGARAVAPAHRQLANPDLPLTGKMPSLGNNWGPRVSLAVGRSEGHWPVLRLGYGMYYGRTENATLETALTQTGSLNGDLNFFMRPTDNLNAGGAPPFPYVFAGEPLNLVKPGAVEFAPNFRNPEVHQAVAAIEETLARPHPTHRQRAAQPRPPPAHLHRHQLRPRRQSRNHHLRGRRRHRQRPHQGRADHRSLLRHLALGHLLNRNRRPPQSRLSADLRGLQPRQLHL